MRTMGSASGFLPATGCSRSGRNSSDWPARSGRTVHQPVSRVPVATEAFGARLNRYRAKPWWPTAATLVVAELGLGAALLIPITFSDPNGVDPYLARLSVASVLLALPSLL